MTMPGGANRLAPQVRVRVNGSDLPPAAAGGLVSVTVQQDVDALGMFAVRLLNWDLVTRQATWSDDPLFELGAEVVVEMGYVDDRAALLTGDITSLEPDFIGDDVPTLLVRGYDRRHRLMRGRKTRSFAQVKDSDIASQVGGDAGLTVEAEDTAVTLDYVLQHNQSDFDFLQARARRIGYEVVVEENTMHFRPRQHAESKVLTLAREVDLLEFRPRLASLAQSGQVTVRGWDVKQKEAIVGTAGVGDERGSMAGATSGPSAAQTAFGDAAVATTDRPIASQPEADAMAIGLFNEIALSFVAGEGVCIGRHDLRAGMVVEVQGVGTRFSGEYYVTAATHTYRPSAGYRTAFSVRRNSM